MGDLDLKQAIGEYRDIYLAYRNFADRTRGEYINDLEDLVEFLGGLRIADVRDVKLNHLVRYMAELDRRGFAGSTRKRKTISIKSFFSFLYTEGCTAINVAKQLIPPLVEARRPRYLTADECKRLLESARGNTRDYAIIQLLLHTGIKLSELTRLTVNDLQTMEATDNKGNKVEYIRVVGNQRNKGRVIPLNQKACSAIEDYLSNRAGSTSGFLFLNRIGERLSERGVEKIVGKYLKLAGISNASVNSLRHTFGTYHAAKGTDKITVQEVMGHRDSRTTGIYYSMTDEIRMSEMVKNGLEL